MHMQPVTSSTIARIGHDPESQLLKVEFTKGGTYTYHGVSAAAHQALMKADSVGKHLHAHIKPHHDYTRPDGVRVNPAGKAVTA